MRIGWFDAIVFGHSTRSSIRSIRISSCRSSVIFLSRTANSLSHLGFAGTPSTGPEHITMDSWGNRVRGNRHDDIRLALPHGRQGLVKKIDTRDEPDIRSV